MNLEEIDKMIKDRESRVEKRVEEGTLYEIQAEKEKEALKKKLEAKSVLPSGEPVPDCPQCGKIMEYDPQTLYVACHDCQIGGRLP